MYKCVNRLPRHHRKVKALCKVDQHIKKLLCALHSWYHKNTSTEYQCSNSKEKFGYDYKLSRQTNLPLNRQTLYNKLLGCIEKG